MEVFLSRCEYVHGNYDVDADFQKLDAEMLKTEEGKRAMQCFICPSTFDFCPGSTNEFQKRNRKPERRE